MDNRGGRQRQHQANGQCHAPWLAERNRDGRNRNRCQPDLQSPQNENTIAQLPELARVHLKTDEEQHHNHAKLGKMLQGHHVCASSAEQRANRDACDQITKDRPKAKPGRQRNRYGSSQEQNKRDKHKFGGHVPSFRSSRLTLWVTIWEAFWERHLAVWYS